MDIQGKDVSYFAAAFSGACSVWAACCVWNKNRHVKRDVAILKGEQAGRLPTVQEFKDAKAKGVLLGKDGYAPVQHLRFVIDMVQPRARRKILQEEALLGSLHDLIVNGTDWYREFSAMSILAALLITFCTLFYKLKDVVESGELTGAKLAPMLGLVGATWPLILLGLVLYGCSALWQMFAWEQFDAWRGWLESSIFPALGASRSTMAKLDRTMGQFVRTADEITQLLKHIQEIPEALIGFKDELANHLIPEITTGLSRVSVGLSDEIVKKLTQAGVDSVAAVKAIQEDQGRIATFMKGAERRTTELATAVQAVAEHTEIVAARFQEQAGMLKSNTEALVGMRDTVASAGESSRKLNDTLLDSEKAAKARSDETRLLIRTVQDLHPHVIATHESVSALTDGVAQLDQSVSASQKTIDQIVGPLQTTAQSLPPFLARAEELRLLWVDAMAGMAALAEQIGQRTVMLDMNSQSLQTSLVLASDRLGAVTEAMTGAGKDFVLLRNEVGALSKYVADAVTAFRDLEITGQKLAELTVMVTGNFEGWQHDTQSLLAHAEVASKSVEESMERVLARAESGASFLQSSMDIVLAQTQTTANAVDLSLGVWRRESAAVFERAEASAKTVEASLGKVARQAEISAGSLQAAMDSVSERTRIAAEALQSTLAFWQRDAAEVFDRAQMASKSVEDSMENVTRRAQSDVAAMERSMSEILKRTQSAAEAMESSIARAAGLVAQLEGTLQAVPGRIAELGTVVNEGVDAWQHDARAVFEKAESTTRSVEASMDRVLRKAESGSESVQKAAEKAGAAIRESLEKTRDTVKELERTLRTAVPRARTPKPAPEPPQAE